MYGDLFLEEFLLYHIKRRDIKHNFSPYFYPLALVEGNEALSKFVGFLAFLPQVILIIYFAFRYHNDLPFCWFLSTFAFVTFNKVCTSQYFVWYIVFLPLVVDRIKMSMKEAVHLILLWFASQGVWLFFAYLFEFRGWQTLELVFAASIGFLLTNIHVMVKILRAYSGVKEMSSKSKVE
ncbi:mannosyltransferase [Ancylostoma ceylanicum]|nr:mannosyltransferase [Ancylostoma ceylanicum]